MDKEGNRGTKKNHQNDGYGQVCNRDGVGREQGQGSDRRDRAGRGQGEGRDRAWTWTGQGRHGESAESLREYHTCVRNRYEFVPKSHLSECRNKKGPSEYSSNLRVQRGPIVLCGLKKGLDASPLFPRRTYGRIWNWTLGLSRCKNGETQLRGRDGSCRLVPSKQGLCRFGPV